MSVQKKSSLPTGVQVWIDGQAESAQNAKVSVFDRGFLYGDSVFETMRTYGGKVFALEAHLERLKQSAERVFIEMPLSAGELAQEIQAAARRSGFPECYVRVMITRGLGALGLDPKDCVEPLRVMLVAPLNPPAESVYREGISVVTYQTSRVNDATEASGAKIGNYLVAVLANRKANQQGAKEALIVNAEGQVVEGATSNVFWLEGQVLCTVPVEAGILAGITRAHILEAASSLGYQVEQRVPRVSELLQADAVFISSSIRELVSVVAIDGIPVGGGQVSPGVLRLHDAFRRLAGAEPFFS